MGNCILKYVHYNSYQNKQLYLKNVQNKNIYEDEDDLYNKRIEIDNLKIEVNQLEQEVIEMRNRKIQRFIDNHW